jgi:hypothetical protein
MAAEIRGVRYDGSFRIPQGGTAYPSMDMEEDFPLTKAKAKVEDSPHTKAKEKAKAGLISESDLEKHSWRRGDSHVCSTLKIASELNPADGLTKLLSGSKFSASYEHMMKCGQCRTLFASDGESLFGRISSQRSQMGGQGSGDRKRSSQALSGRGGRISQAWVGHYPSASISTLP